MISVFAGTCIRTLTCRIGGGRRRGRGGSFVLLLLGMGMTLFLIGLTGFGCLVLTLPVCCLFYCFVLLLLLFFLDDFFVRNIVAVSRGVFAIKKKVYNNYILERRKNN